MYTEFQCGNLLENGHLDGREGSGKRTLWIFEKSIVGIGGG
jgi:hypothetical protein